MNIFASVALLALVFFVTPMAPIWYFYEAVKRMKKIPAYYMFSLIIPCVFIYKIYKSFDKPISSLLVIAWLVTTKYITKSTIIELFEKQK